MVTSPLSAGRAHTQHAVDPRLGLVAGFLSALPATALVYAVTIQLMLASGTQRDADMVEFGFFFNSVFLSSLLVPPFCAIVYLLAAGPRTRPVALPVLVLCWAVALVTPDSLHWLTALLPLAIPIALFYAGGGLIIAVVLTPLAQAARRKWAWLLPR